MGRPCSVPERRNDVSDLQALGAEIGTGVRGLIRLRAIDAAFDQLGFLARTSVRCPALAGDGPSPMSSLFRPSTPAAPSLWKMAEEHRLWRDAEVQPPEPHLPATKLNGHQQ